MKRATLLNSEISHAIARLGHTQTLVIGDAGLPIPPGPQRIDLAVAQGLPPFMAVFEAVTSEMMVERVTIAEEMATANPTLRAAFDAAVTALAKRQGKPVAVDVVPHETFKRLTAESVAMVRTGECSPYANVILSSGVTF